MSWHKAALSARVTWIGWSFDLEHYTVELDPAKLRRLLEWLRSLSASPRCTVSALEKLTGKLLWLSNLFQAFRPSLAPLYADQHRPIPNMCAVSADLCSSLRSSLSADLHITSSLPLAAIPVRGLQAAPCGAHACHCSQGGPGAHLISQGMGPGCQPPPSGERALSRIPGGHRHVDCTCQFATALPITLLPSVVRARHLPTHVRMPHLQVLEVLSAFRMVDRHALRRRCRHPCCPTCFRGSRLALPPSIASLLGRCLLKSLCSGFCPVCCRLGMLRFMWSSALTTPLPSRRPGRALLLPGACANSSVSSVCSRSTLASPSIWTPSPASLMMLQMPLAVLFRLPHSASSQLRFGPCRGHHFPKSRILLTSLCPPSWRVTSRTRLNRAQILMAVPPAGSSSSSIALGFSGIRILSLQHRP